VRSSFKALLAAAECTCQRISQRSFCKFGVIADVVSRFLGVAASGRSPSISN